MTIKKKLAAIFAAAGSFALIAASTPFVMDAAAKSTYGDAFIYTQEEPMKYKTSYSVPSISEDKGSIPVSRPPSKQLRNGTGSKDNARDAPFAASAIFSQKNCRLL